MCVAGSNRCLEGRCFSGADRALVYERVVEGSACLEGVSNGSSA